MRKWNESAGMTCAAASDFQAAPLEAFATLLRGWAIEAIQSLASDEAPTIVMSDDQARTLLAILNSAQPKSRLVERIDGVGDRLGVVEDAFSDLAPMERLVLDKERRPSLIETMRSQIWERRDWTGSGPVEILAMSAALGELAFKDERVSICMVLALRKIIKRRVLICQGEALYSVRLTSEFYWCLLALSMRSSEGGRNRVRSARAQEFFYARVRIIAMRSGWAGFWEQWLLLEILKFTPSPEAKDLVQMLQCLPIIRCIEDIISANNLFPAASHIKGGEGIDANEPEGEEGHRMARIGWYEDAPSFAIRLVTGSV